MAWRGSHGFVLPDLVAHKHSNKTIQHQSHPHPTFID
jgi:hypothetical protein